MAKSTLLACLTAFPVVVACSQGADPPATEVTNQPNPSVAPVGVQPPAPVVGDGTAVPPGQPPSTITPTTPPVTTGGPSVNPTPPVTGSVPPVDTGTGPLVPVPTVACAGELPKQDAAGATHTLSAPFGSPIGELPHFWTTFGLGRLGLYLERESLSEAHAAQDKDNFQGRRWSEVLREHTLDAITNLELRSIRAHGMFHDDIGMYSEDASGNPVFDFSRSDQIFDFLVQNNVAPIIELASMPAALAADPSRTVFDWKMIVSPPKDYSKWQALVQAFVQHSVDRYGADVANSWYYEVWNEPECCNGKFWGGSGTRATAQEYFQLYDAAAAGVRAVLPSGRVGGPVTSQPSELTAGQWEGGAGILFLDHIQQTQGALDFFTFHTWSFLDGAVNGYFQGLDLLDQYNLNHIRVAVTEFGPTWEFGLRGVGMEPDWEPQETSQGAAFAAQVYSDISRRAAQDNRRFPIAYAWWTLSDIFDEGYEDPEDYVLEDNPFIGAMGLINREGIKKPAYNAYKFLAQLGHEQLPLSVQSPGGVNGLAARDNQGGVQVIVYNGQSPGQGFRDDVYYAITEAQPISITIDGLNPETAYDVATYRVDETHGNSFAVWNAQGRPPMSQMGDAEWQALRDGAESQAEVVGTALCGTSITLNLQLSSPGVAFLKLTPAVL